MAKQSTAVATKAQAGVPAFMVDIESVAGLGNSTSVQDNALPFLAIIQKGSPQINRQKPEFIVGAEVGDLFNTATNKLYKTSQNPLHILVVGFQKAFVEWVPRSAGGGFVAQHTEGAEVGKTAIAKMVDGKARGLQLPNGNDYVETAYTFITPVDEAGQVLCIGAASSALSVMRKWMSMRNGYKIPGTAKSYPAFARVYALTTAYQENESGDWYNWKVEDIDWVNEDLYNIGLELAKQAQRGEMKVGNPEAAMGGAGSDEDESIPV